MTTENENSMKLPDEKELKNIENLENMYEYVKDTLSQQSQMLSASTLKSTFLWGAITTILGIVIPIASQIGKIKLNSPVLYSVLALYAVTTILSWITIFPQSFEDVPDFDNIWDDFSERTKEVFWYDMYTYIARSSKSNERRLLRYAWITRIISLTTLIQFGLIFYWIWIK